MNTLVHVLDRGSQTRFQDSTSQNVKLQYDKMGSTKGGVLE
ncbi:MAG: hypothetical protein V1799_20800 [bacterium]